MLNALWRHYYVWALSLTVQCTQVTAEHTQLTQATHRCTDCVVPRARMGTSSQKDNYALATCRTQL